MNGSVIKALSGTKFYDYTHFPKQFKIMEEALDTYNELGYQHEI